MVRRILAVPLFLLALLVMSFTLDAAPAAAEGGDPVSVAVQQDEPQLDAETMRTLGAPEAPAPVVRLTAPLDFALRADAPVIDLPDIVAVPSMDSHVDGRAPPEQPRLNRHESGESSRASSPYAKRAKRAT